MKHLFTAAALLLSMTAFAQVGINNTSPKATLDITAKTTDGSKPEGLIIPQLSGNNIHTATAAGVYGSNQKGLIIYATSADSSPISTTANITSAGYYYFDGGAWQRILETSSGDTTNDGWVNDTTNSMVKLGAKADGTARAAGTDFVVKDDGKVGIGTATPGSLLDLVADNKGTAGQDDLTLSSYNSTGSPSAGLIFRVARGTAAAPANLQNGDDLVNIISSGRIGGNVTNSSSIIARYKGDGTTNLSSLTFNASGINRMLIDENGRVGIGTTAPKTNLHVTSPAGQSTPIAAFSIVNCGAGCAQSTAKNIVLNNAQANNSLFASIDFVPGTDPLGDSGASIQGIDRDATNNYAGLSFFTRNATDYDSRMVIKSSGNVGVGTNAPITKLDTRTNPGNASPGNGAIAIGETTQTASAAGAGAMRYNTTSKDIQYSDGASWSSLAKSDLYGGFVPVVKLVARKTTAQSIGTNSTATITFPTVVSNPDGAYNATTGIYTIPAGESGLYMVSGAFNVSPNNFSNAFDIKGVFNGVYVIMYTIKDLQNTNVDMGGSVAYYMTAGQQISIASQTCNGCSASTYTYNSGVFSITKLSAN
ncbi:hypothetical protein SAMN05421846_101634 [Chryseobacterium taeanense]|uniref:C1q domain-containing protein n=1 Tax=Chryseobacterium taeanense TaxID=311334 RepID=A0A1G8EM97_9FLAO|nr:hypothetical protein [Chryseobacterium taeanense]SDH70819.1 hypothetical protein SAMN05421846_101634 [Chryseobacterium taeanense]